MSLAGLHTIPLLADQGSALLPPQASTFAEQHDGVFYFILVICAFFFVLVMGAAGYFVYKFRRRSSDDRTSPLKHSGRLEFGWSAVPAVLLIVIFMWGKEGFTELSMTPTDALDVRVTGKTWQWNIDYPTLDKSCANKMVLPVNRPAKLTISSLDVIHSFWIPAFRAKRDAVPNRYTGFWVEPTMTGEFPFLCAEYCGQGHSQMVGTVVVMEQGDFDAWVASDDCGIDLSAAIAVVGPKLFKKYGCDACHSVEGKKIVGPPLDGVWGQEHKLADGSTRVVDDNYVRQSLMDPNSEIVAGFTPQMPSFQGQMSDEEVAKIIDYLKFLSGAGEEEDTDKAPDEGGTKAPGDQGEAPADPGKAPADQNE